MTFQDHPRLIGPIQRGTKAWQRLYGARSASERTNSYDQEVIANAHPLRMRGLKAFRFAGAIRTLAQLLGVRSQHIVDTKCSRDIVDINARGSQDIVDIGHTHLNLGGELCPATHDRIKKRPNVAARR